MLSNADVEQARRDLADFREDRALTRILQTHETLLSDYNRLMRDYEEACDARDAYKAACKASKGRNPYAMVIVDGFGYVFHEEWLLNGSGKKAAKALHDRVKSSLREKGLENCEILVRVDVNVQGLASTLTRYGQHDSVAKLWQFVASFNKTYDNWNFVDGASTKLRETLKFVADDPRCKHIYFAACNNADFAPDIAAYADENPSRITLVEACNGGPIGRSFKRLRLNIESFPEVFQAAPAPSTGAVQAPVRSSPTPSSRASSESKPQTAKPLCKYIAQGGCKRGKSCPFDHPPNAKQTVFQGKTAEETQLLSKLPTKEDIPDLNIDCPVNEAGWRLDPYLPPSSFKASWQLEGRTPKICKNFHLRGHCTDGQRCPLDHSVLTRNQLDGVEVIGRLTPCVSRGMCRDAGCYRAHVCQLPGCMRRGGNRPCKMPILMHPEDLTLHHFERDPHRATDTTPHFGFPQRAEETESTDDNKTTENSRFLEEEVLLPELGNEPFAQSRREMTNSPGFRKHGRTGRRAAARGQGDFWNDSDGTDEFHNESARDNQGTGPSPVSQMETASPVIEYQW